MSYLVPAEYLAFGLDPATPAAIVNQASSLIDSHCRRPTLNVAEYTERVRLSPGRLSLQLSFLPLVTVAPAVSPFLQVRGRYGKPRRGDEPAIAAEIGATFGLNGTWTAIDPLTLDFFPDTGEVTIQNPVLGPAFQEIEVKYSAGLAQIPDTVKHACAQIVRNALATPALNVKRGSLDKIKIEYFRESLIDENVRTLLRPYVCTKVA